MIGAHVGAAPRRTGSHRAHEGLDEEAHRWLEPHAMPSIPDPSDNSWRHPPMAFSKASIQRSASVVTSARLVVA
jgi:hypothetical protein